MKIYPADIKPFISLLQGWAYQILQTLWRSTVLQGQRHILVFQWALASPEVSTGSLLPPAAPPPERRLGRTFRSAGNHMGCSVAI